MSDDDDVSDLIVDGPPRGKRERKTIKPQGRARRPPTIADPRARQLLRDAAEAVGIPVKQLIEMAIEGAISLPAAKVAHTYTLEDLGKRLWADLQTYARPLRAEWFAGLQEVQQHALIVVLRDRAVPTMAISQELNVPIPKVVDIWNHHCDEIGSQVVGMKLDTIVGHLQARSDLAQSMAVEADDHANLWKIAKEHVETLQSLGVVDRAIHRVDHHHTHALDDAKRGEIDRLVQLEAKKDRRFEEIKVADAKIIATDSVPQLTTDYDEDEGEQEKL